jgi:hypothetical protein
MRRLHPRDIVAAGLLVMLALVGGHASAQSGSPPSTVSVNGKVSSMTESELTVVTSSGPVVVTLMSDTIIHGEVPVHFYDIA